MTSPLRGFFDDGIWRCNCDPRLPAAKFQVKKRGANNGRWFYTCQKSKDDGGCGLFLWKEDAAIREMRAVIGNLTSEVERPVTPASALSTIVSLKSEDGDDDEENFGDWPLSPEDERDIARRLAQTVPGSPSLHTPRKAVKTNEIATPGSKRKLDEHMLPTPSTGGRSLAGYGTGIKDEDILTNPFSGHKVWMWHGNEQVKLRSPPATPTPTRYRKSSGARASQEPQGTCVPQNYDIGDEVLGLLKDQHIDDDTMASLRALLSKHALKTCGIAKGRDITRMALRAKDSKIAELQQKISALEAQREIDRTVIRHFKSDIAGSFETRRAGGKSRGRGSG
ncbi:hypothetical protein PZA11_002961 [Diplocarpon coronariae]|uniref:GRF-type domain-containing protein n=1 Tax=Diplocarpon coronariae TaxID=2795749 RepID=A0A218Z657_9HELO|nr:hypothetical protein JHW43_000999 [Diplocarpon mali]OWP03003.1 hypothetical protein B2J93_3629 [Marssonina coronariae]